MRLVAAIWLSKLHALQDVMLPSAWTSEPTHVVMNWSQEYDARDPPGLGSPQAKLQPKGPVAGPPLELPLVLLELLLDELACPEELLLDDELACPEELLEELLPEELAWPDEEAVLPDELVLPDVAPMVLVTPPEPPAPEELVVEVPDVSPAPPEPARAPCVPVSPSQPPVAAPAMRITPADHRTSPERRIFLTSALSRGRVARQASSHITRSRVTVDMRATVSPKRLHHCHPCQRWVDTGALGSGTPPPVRDRPAAGSSSDTLADRMRVETRRRTEALWCVTLIAASVPGATGCRSEDHQAGSSRTASSQPSCSAWSDRASGGEDRVSYWTPAGSIQKTPQPWPSRS
jgi:hypothetical protein